MVCVVMHLVRCAERVAGLCPCFSFAVGLVTKCIVCAFWLHRFPPLCWVCQVSSSCHQRVRRTHPGQAAYYIATSPSRPVRSVARRGSLLLRCVVFFCRLTTTQVCGAFLPVDYSPIAAPNPCWGCGVSCFRGLPRGFVHWEATAGGLLACFCSN